MDRVLWLHAAYAETYLDDVILHSNTSADHVQRVAVVLESLKQAGRPQGQTKEVCSWIEGGTVSGIPLGGRAGVSTDGEVSRHCIPHTPQDKKGSEAVHGPAWVL